MKRMVLCAVFVILTAVRLVPAVSAETNLKNINSGPLVFTENQGQFGEKTLFKSEAGNVEFYFCRDEVACFFTRRGAQPPVEDISGLPSTGRSESSASPKEGMLLLMRFLDANPDPQISGQGAPVTKSNYILGNDQLKWKSGVPGYSAIIYKNIYPGIDLRYLGNGSSLKYEFIIYPEGDPLSIRLKYEGADGLDIGSAGGLEIRTAWGEIGEKAPFIFQESSQGKQEYAGRFKLLGSDAFGFEIDGGYDRTRPLVIDPQLVFSSYLGGSRNEGTAEIAFGPDGNIYILGSTNSPNFPMLEPYDDSHGGGLDVFITVFTPGMDSLLYSTYIGGDSSDAGYGLGFDPSGQICIMGLTYSPNFPVLQAYDSLMNGLSDVFVAKLSPSGDSLRYGTFIGGSDYDECYDGKVGPDGSVYAAGRSTSSNFPMANPYDAANTGDIFDCILLRLAPDGQSLVYSTYLGGRAWDESSAIVVNDAGEAIIAGSSCSIDFPMVDPIDSTLGQRGNYNTEVFIAHFSADGTNLLFSSFLGGSENHSAAHGIALDSWGNIYVTGRTNSEDFPLVNPYDAVCGSEDAFISKISAGAHDLVYSSYLGGEEQEWGTAIAANDNGMAYVVGFSRSSGFPSINAIYPTLNGWKDIFISAVSTTGECVPFSTFLGGSDGEEGQTALLGPDGALYISGLTGSNDFPVINPYDNSFNGWDTDCIIAKVNLGVIEVSRGSISGSVRTIDGDPIEGVEVILPEKDSILFTDSFGGYNLPDLCPFAYKISFHHPDYFDTTVIDVLVGDGQAVTLDVALSAKGSLAGIVTDTAGVPLEGVAVQQIVWQGRADTTDNLGQYFIRGITPGTYNVKFSLVHYFDTIATNINIMPAETTTVNIALTDKTINALTWFGNPDGSPVEVQIGRVGFIDFYIQTIDSLDIFFIEAPLGLQSVYVDSFLSQEMGIVHEPLAEWDEVRFYSPVGSPPNYPGWSSQSMMGYAYLNDPPPPPWPFPSAPLKLCSFAFRAVYDTSLIGDTIACIGLGSGYSGDDWRGVLIGNLEGTSNWHAYEYYSPILFKASPVGLYASGDANGNDIFNGIDVTYSVNYFKGAGAPPPLQLSCQPHGLLYAAADANGNCVFNGIDVTYSVNYLKGMGPAPTSCPDCPPMR